MGCSRRRLSNANGSVTIRDNSNKAEVAGKTTSAKLHFGAARVRKHGRVVAVVGADSDAVTLPPAVMSEL